MMSPMTETGIIALVGIVATLAGTLFGAWIATRAAARQFAAQRSNQLRDAQRALLVEIITSARAFRDAIASVTNKHTKASTLKDARNVKVLSIPNTPDTGSAIIESRATLRRAVTEAQILVDDQPLLDAIAVLGSIPERWFGEVITLNEASYEAGETEADRFDRARNFDRGVLNAINDCTTKAKVLRPTA